MINEEATYEKFGYYPRDLKQQSHKKIITLCDDCGKVRILSKGSYHALCSSCAVKGENNPRWKGGLVMRICKNCGVGFPVKPSNIKIGKGKGTFCNRKCQGKWRSTHQRGENSTNWKGGDILRICEQCGIEFHVCSSEIKRGGGRFCSHQCADKWYSKHFSGKNSPLWKNGASFEPYCEKFNEAFKEYIRDKFGRICFLCSKTEEENGQRLSVHHCNGDKNCGCDGDETCQFVPLCVSCHSKVHSKKVDWEKKIKDKMQNKLNGWYI